MAEFVDHFVIKPTINFTNPTGYLVSPIGESRRPVSLGIRYISDNYPEQLSKDQLLTLLEGSH